MASRLLHRRRPTDAVGDASLRWILQVNFGTGCESGVAGPEPEAIARHAPCSVNNESVSRPTIPSTTIGINTTSCSPVTACQPLIRATLGPRLAARLSLVEAATDALRRCRYLPSHWALDPPPPPWRIQARIRCGLATLWFPRGRRLLLLLMASAWRVCASISGRELLRLLWTLPMVVSL